MAWPMALCGKWRCRSFQRRRVFPELLNRQRRPRLRCVAHRTSLQLLRAAGDRRRDSEDVRFLKSGESRGHMPLLRAFDTPCTWAAENGLTMKFVSDLTEVFPEMFYGEGNGPRSNEDSIPVAGRSSGESAMGGGPATFPARRWSGQLRVGGKAGALRCDSRAIHDSPITIYVPRYFAQVIKRSS